MSTRTKWVCPTCSVAYAVPANKAGGLTICPTCAGKPPRTQRKRSRLPLILATSFIALAGIAAFFLMPWNSSSGTHFEFKLPAAIAGDPDKAKVNKWLKENLNSGIWEEIQWCPDPAISKMAEHTSQTLQTQIDDLKRRYDLSGDGKIKEDRFALYTQIEHIKTLKALQDSLIGRRICGMKFRTANPFGAKIVREELFDTTSSVEMIDGISQKNVAFRDACWKHLRGENN